jgi:Protein of unknown function (DUF2380)
MNYALCALAVPLLALILPTMTQAAAVRSVAVFDFELIDTSLEGSMNGPRADQQARLMEISERLRQALAKSDKFRVVDIEPVEAKARSFHLQECGGCDADLARKVGAQLSITGTVQKVSNLILNMNIYVKDVASGRMIAGMSADMRGNTEESWTRTLDWLIVNRLFPALEGAHE